MLTKHVLVKVRCPMTSTPTALPSGRPPKPAMDFAQIMDQLDFVKEQLAASRRRDQAFTPLRIMFGSAIPSALVTLWFEAFWRHCF